MTGVAGGEKEGGVSSPALGALIEELPAAVLGQALTHSSWVDNRVRSYERLEFLGDSVLGLAVAAELYDRYPGENEGDLARWKAFVVSRGSCHVVACRLGIDELVRRSAPAVDDARVELAESATALGNILEALLGACFLTYGFERTRAAIADAFNEQFTYAVAVYVDFKSTLQEHLAAAGRPAAEYSLAEEEGPPHRRLFTSEVSLGDGVAGSGSGRSIKKSEQRAARAALVRLGVLPDDGVEEDDRDDDAPACQFEGDGS